MKYLACFWYQFIISFKQQYWLPLTNQYFRNWYPRNSTANNTFTWNSFAGAVAGDVIEFQVMDVQTEAFPVKVILASGTTSYTIPANTLSADKRYEVGVAFIKGKEVKKIIVVPGKLINIVVK